MDSPTQSPVCAPLTVEIQRTDSDLVPGTVGDSSYFSVPRLGDRNVFQRSLRVTYRVLHGRTDVTNSAVVTKVTVTLLADTGTRLQQVLAEGPGPRVTVVAPGQLEVRVTHDTVASTIATDPPPSHGLTYEMVLRARDPSHGTEVDSPPFNAVGFHGLWRMPPTFGRYGPCSGTREPGLDDWVSQEAYQWMTQNARLITPVNDISGEHARNLGHNTHARGTDIDMFHVYVYPFGRCAGGANYKQLALDVDRALGGDPAAQQRVTAWVTQTRDRFDDLLALPNVRQVIYAIGCPVYRTSSGRHAPVKPCRSIPAGAQMLLQTGWAKSLLRSGTYQDPTGRMLNLGVGIWANASHARMFFNATHNDHVHVTLNLR